MLFQAVIRKAGIIVDLQPLHPARGKVGGRADTRLILQDLKGDVGGP